MDSGRDIRELVYDTFQESRRWPSRRQEEAGVRLRQDYGGTRGERERMKAVDPVSRGAWLWTPPPEGEGMRDDGGDESGERNLKPKRELLHGDFAV